LKHEGTREDTAFIMGMETGRFAILNVSGLFSASLSGRDRLEANWNFWKWTVGSVQLSI